MGGSEAFSWEKFTSTRRLNTSVGFEDSLSLSRRSDSNSSLIAPQFNRNQTGSSGICGNEVGLEVTAGRMERGEISLRQWLDKPERVVDRLECLHVFQQIVETINLAHSQGVVVHNVRPSCFVMSSFNRVSFIESGSCSSSSADSSEDGLDGRVVGGHCSTPPSLRGLHQQSSRLDGADSVMEIPPEDASHRASHTTCLESSSAFPTCLSSIEEAERRKSDDNREDGVGDSKKKFPLKHILLMEMSWYTSPEEVDGTPSSFSSDIYRLGVLLFELFCTFNSTEEKLGTMSSLRHRLLPPQLLLKWPKEATFCLWLLHPQPNTRPKMSELLQSEFLSSPRDSLEEREAAIKLKEQIEDQELLLEFLLQMQQRKQEAVDKLQDTIGFLSVDTEEVTKRLSAIKEKSGSLLELNKDNLSSLEKVECPSSNHVRNEDSSTLGSRKRSKPGFQIRDTQEGSEHSVEVQKAEKWAESQEIVQSKSSRVMKNFKKLESAYFSTRCRLIEARPEPLNRCSQLNSSGKGSTAMTGGTSVDNLASKKGYMGNRKSEWINPFLEGLCRYLSFSKLKVKGDLKQGDLLNSSNLVCSLSFDRDKEFFATAGVNRKIKIFECDMILNEDRDIHYPVVEMASRSKLSSICWNSYIKSQIASSDFEGVVQVWDVTRSEAFMEMREHEKRVWSVDFSQSDPTKLASGSDDGAVKLWNINQGGSVATIKTKANICSVQFPPDSARRLAIGSADHRIYYYDLRNKKTPLHILNGHSKTVSYVKFIDPTTLVSASTDNSIKLWDLSTCTSRTLDNPLQTFTGHTNVKNFVGLSISDGYIATGSESNEVFVYHKAFSMPVLSYKFSSTEPLSGNEVDDANQFISSVCWRGQSTTLVAANSTGNIKLLEMI